MTEATDQAHIKWVNMTREQIRDHFGLSERGLTKMATRKQWHRLKNMGGKAIWRLPETDLDDKGDGRRINAPQHHTE